MLKINTLTAGNFFFVISEYMLMFIYICVYVYECIRAMRDIREIKETSTYCEQYFTININDFTSENLFYHERSGRSNRQKFHHGTVPS